METLGSLKTLADFLSGHSVNISKDINFQHLYQILKSHPQAITVFIRYESQKHKSHHFKSVMGHESQTGSSVIFQKCVYLMRTALQSSLMIFARNLEEIYQSHNY